MTRMTMRFRAIASVLCLLVGATYASAQTVTTGSLAGVVTDAQGGVLPGATVTAVHTPTGTSYEAVTDGDGHYTILNMRVGPYTVSAVMSGFKRFDTPNVAVGLGEQKTVDFKLQLDTLTETVEVTGVSSVIDSSRAGTADNVSQQAVENLPTISRNIVDIARTSPYFNPTGLNEDPMSLSVAGRNNRYNNVQIDGAVFNDLFGLAASGTPGGQTETQPISLDAIQELQLVVSPYDVRQGGFSGGGINAITRSGSNALRGTGYYFGRNQDWVGESPTGTKVGAVQGQAVRRQRRRPVRAKPRVLLRQRRLEPQGQSCRRVDRRQRPAVRPRRGNPALPQHPADALQLQPGGHRRVHPHDQFRQVFRPRRFQRRAGKSADGPAQLPERVERHRTPERGLLRRVLHAGCVLPHQEQDELHRGAVEQRVGHRGQRAALHLSERAR